MYITCISWHAQQRKRGLSLDHTGLLHRRILNTGPSRQAQKMCHRQKASILEWSSSMRESDCMSNICIYIYNKSYIYILYVLLYIHNNMLHIYIYTYYGSYVYIYIYVYTFRNVHVYIYIYIYHYI